jgi:hypothetical protein
MPPHIAAPESDKATLKTFPLVDYLIALQFILVKILIHFKLRWVIK